VHVSVIDTLNRAPIERLRALQEAAGESPAPAIFRFTLGGWLFAYPDQRIWFTNGSLPATESVALRDHEEQLLRAREEVIAWDTLASPSLH
jgi:hypothetical protein